MLANNSPPPLPSSEPFSCLENGNNNKRKRRPAGTPDPDAEVVSLSPKTLLESDRYVCEICNQGFQRDQNLQMHRRRHKVPWKLLKRESPVVRKRVFVCPEPTCLHHDPCHALGDLVGIKKHFRRKHSNHKQWVCHKCSKAYAVQSDFKAHLKTCGTRGHSCDCGRVFSRVESFIEHQDACNMGRLRSDQSQVPHPQLRELPPPSAAAPCLSRTASSPSRSSTDTNNLVNNNTTDTTTNTSLVILSPGSKNPPRFHNLDLQLSTAATTTTTATLEENLQCPTQLQLSIGSSDFGEKNSPRESSTTTNNTNHNNSNGKKASAARVMKEEAREQLKAAMAEKSYAEEARRQAKRQMEMAEKEFANAKRMRQQAQAELDKAQALKDHALKQLNSTLLQLTCHSCKQTFQFHSRTATTTAAAYNMISECHQMLDNDHHHVILRRDLDHHLHHHHRVGKSSN
ncbi:protein SHOOT GRAVITROPISM 5-like [Morus notabilis]|uniref:protein SHOOT GRAVITROPISM 5-like n=1 Tax=Morus notabilis TaxID=981085 RepID=UPI000CED0EFF|nr:protein SHOOT GRAVITROPISM 5-like [Morus notabilis]